MGKDYVIKDGVLRFEDYVSRVPSMEGIPATVTEIDFNNAILLPDVFDISHTQVRFIDFKKIIVGYEIILPYGCVVVENLYMSYPIKHYVGGDHPRVCHLLPERFFRESARMRYLRSWNKFTIKVYLSGTVTGKLDLRKAQRDELMATSKLLGVYSPGNHITFGDPAIEKIPGLVYLVDEHMLNNCDVFLFDLNDLSLTPGTIAELGYVVGKGWEHKCYYMMNTPTPNFFINGLLRKMAKVDSLQDFVRRVMDGS